MFIEKLVVVSCSIPTSSFLFIFLTIIPLFLFLAPPRCIDDESSARTSSKIMRTFILEINAHTESQI